MTAFCAHICVLGQMSSFEFLLEGGSTTPQNGEVKALSVSVP